MHSINLYWLSQYFLCCTKKLKGIVEWLSSLVVIEYAQSLVFLARVVLNPLVGRCTHTRTRTHTHTPSLRMRIGGKNWRCARDLRHSSSVMTTATDPTPRIPGRPDVLQSLSILAAYQSQSEAKKRGVLVCHVFEIHLAIIIW